MKRIVAIHLAGATAGLYHRADMPSLNAAKNQAPGGQSLGVVPRLPFAGLSSDVVDAALARVLASATFRRSERHRNFLRHVVRATLEGRQAELKEVVIGLEVFEKSLDVYDPRHDPIVRVEAGRVREKLARYYAAEGASDPFELQIPTGGYLPEIFQRQHAPRMARSLGSLAVLPISSLSGGTDDDVFCSALANQLIDVLGRVPGLRVIGRVSAARAHAQKNGYRSLGKLLGVSSVIEGSIQRSGARYRCLVQKFRTRDGLCEWSQRFEGIFDQRVDHFGLQDEICEAVIAAVRSRETGRPAPSPVIALVGDHVSSEARDLFARGRYLAQRHEVADYRSAIALLKRAVTLSPGFTSAYSQLAMCQDNLAVMVATPVKAAFDEIEFNAKRALELDPLDSDARTTLAHIVWRIDHDWLRAERMFIEALRAAPNSARTHRVFGSSLIYVGRYVEGLQHVRIALDLDPLNLTSRAAYALGCSYARDYETALREYESVLSLEPLHMLARVMIGMTHMWRGDPVAARPHFEQAVSIAPDHPIAGFDLAMCIGAAGAVEEGRLRLDAHVARIGTAPYARYNLAQAEAFLGNTIGAMNLLRQSAAANEILFNIAAVDPTFDSYRDDPAFVELLVGYGLQRVPPSPYLVTT